MSPERLLKHFNQIAESPDAVPRLRRFILDLAVRGKLVEQDPKDEPASKLLKRIEAEKARLLKEGTLKKQILIKPENNELPFELPDLWMLSSLGEVAQYGLPDKVDSNKQISSDTWVLDLEDIEKDTSCLLNRVFSFDRPFQSSKTCFKKGDVLFGKLRPYLNKVIVADMDGVCSSEIVPVRGFCKMASEYIRLILKSPLTMNRVDRLMYGMKMPRLGTNDALALSFPLPPLAEQHRIVAKVDELMALCDDLEKTQAKRESRRDRLVAATLLGLNNGDTNSESGTSIGFAESARFYFNHLPRLTTRPEHIQQLRQTILNLAVHGKLIPQNSHDQPAVELLKRIAGEKQRLIKQGKLKKQEDIEPADKTDTPFEVPIGWEWVCAGSVFLNVTDGFHNTPTPTIKGYKYLTAKHIRPGKIDFENCLYVDEKNHKQLFAKTRVKQGDILIVNIGDYTAQSFHV